MPPSALLTDFYQLTMMSGYFESGRTEERCTFELFFRKLPFKGGFCLAAGLEQALDYLEGLRFRSDDVAYLDGLNMFSPEFLAWLADFRFRGCVWALPEGTLVFPNVPLVRIEATLPEAQLVESALLNIVNFQTLIASKAARVCYAAGAGQILEFGLRRAQGPDGALSASRAAYIGGCTATSNTLAGQKFGIPVRGTQAHSWVMSFTSELEAFRSYGERFPDNCLLLVDTYDTLKSGVPNAIQVGRELAAKGHRLAGIRLDSGDLAALSREARVMLDEAGFPDARIVASNDLDEYLIESLLLQGARIDVWGVGTQLVTSKDEPALGGVYKLVSIQEADGGLRPCLKMSSNPGKVTTPGVKQVYRALDEEGNFLGDCIALASEDFAGKTSVELIDPLYVSQQVTVTARGFVPLLEKVLEHGQRRANPPLPNVQQRAREQLQAFPQAGRRLQNPHLYPVGLSPELFALRDRLIKEHRQK